MEASLLQIYSPRDPLQEVLRGEISLRKFRVMVEGVPLTATTPVGRAINGPWSDQHRLLHVIGSAMISLDTNFYNVHRERNATPAETKPLWRPELTAYQKEAAETPDVDMEHRTASEEDLLKVLSSP